MAKQVQTILVDDLDGGTAEETVAFALDGVAYEIDLSGKNASKLRDAFASYVGVARKAPKGGTRVAGVRPRGTAVADREQNQAIRDWAKKKGFNVSDRGRIPADIVEKYNASN